MIQPLTIAACAAAATLLCATATLSEIIRPRAESSTVLVAVRADDRCVLVECEYNRLQFACDKRAAHWLPAQYFTGDGGEMLSVDKRDSGKAQPPADAPCGGQGGGEQ